VTASTRLYSSDKLPQGLAWQALSFLRCEWPFLFSGGNRLRSRPFGDGDTTCATRIEAEVLLSYAEVLQVKGTRAGTPVRILGLSNVFTSPPHRGEGHGSAIIQTVGELIDQSDAEVALLFCEDDLVPFYGARGWHSCPTGTVQAPGSAPATMAKPGPGLETGLMQWLVAAPLQLDSRW
jgi:hypothetical protein